MKLKLLVSFVVACVISLSAASASAQTPACTTGVFAWVDGAMTGAPIQFNANGTVETHPYGPYASWLTVFMSPQPFAACNGVSWTLTSTDAAFTIAANPYASIGSASVSGIGSRTLKVIAAPNTGPARAAQLVLIVTGPNAVTTRVLVTITQAGR